MSTLLAPTPVFKAFSNDGTPLTGGLLYSYIAGTSTPQATYKDSTLGSPNTNPIVLNARGECALWFDPSLTYKLQLTDALGNQIPGYPVDNILGAFTATGSLIPAVDNSFTLGNTFSSWAQLYLGASHSPALDVATGIIGFYPKTTAETTAGVTPTDYAYIPGDIRRYGAVLDGLTDDTVSAQNWAKVVGPHTFPVVQTALITAEIPLFSNSDFIFTKGGGFTTATHDIAFFRATSQNNIIVRGGTFTQTSAGTAGAYNIGGIALDRCTNCRIESNTFVGMQWSGVLLLATTNTIVRGNYMSAALGTNQDAADISCISNPSNGSAFNLIEDNYCFGGCEHGIALMDTYSGILPTRNVVTHNFIGTHTGYGILHYMPDTGDSFNEISFNEIEGITGSFASNPSSGAGIYSVGAGSGGAKIIGNTVRNCCVSTGNASLAPAGIGINSTPAGSTPIVISANIIEGMTQYHSIQLTGVLGGASVTSNTILHPTQTGTVGDAIQIANSNNVTVTGNTITNPSTTTTSNCILIYANTLGCTNIVVNGNTVKGGHASQIRCAQVGGNQVQDLVISGNILDSGDNTCIPLLFDSGAAINVTVNGNIMRGGNATVISQAACTSVRYSNNYVNGTGTAILTTSGTCTGSFYNSSNFGQGTGAGVVNGATGFIVEQLGTGAPGAGTWAIGDMIRNSNPSAAGVLFWVTTTAGAGTWKTVSNT